jgi:hypothetical protein
MVSYMFKRLAESALLIGSMVLSINSNSHRHEHCAKGRAASKFRVEQRANSESSSEQIPMEGLSLRETDRATRGPGGEDYSRSIMQSPRVSLGAFTTVPALQSQQLSVRKNRR